MRATCSWMRDMLDQPYVLGLVRDEEDDERATAWVMLARRCCKRKFGIITAGPLLQRWTSNGMDSTHKLKHDLCAQLMLPPHHHSMWRLLSVAELSLWSDPYVVPELEPIPIREDATLHDAGLNDGSYIVVARDESKASQIASENAAICSRREGKGEEKESTSGTMGAAPRRGDETRW